MEKIREMERIFREELKGTDTIEITVSQVEVFVGESIYSQELEHRIIRALMLLPCGVISRSHTMEGLVETSINAGSLQEEEGEVLRLLLAARSSVDSRKYFLKDQLYVLDGSMRKYRRCGTRHARFMKRCLGNRRNWRQSMRDWNVDTGIIRSRSLTSFPLDRIFLTCIPPRSGPPRNRSPRPGSI